jgi:hypothetical protein
MLPLPQAAAFSHSKALMKRCSPKRYSLTLPSPGIWVGGEGRVRELRNRAACSKDIGYGPTVIVPQTSLLLMEA